MIIIGLTGGIGSGKSTISKMLKNLGAVIIDADIIAREVVSKGEKSYNRIIECFGKEILLPNGEINRKALGSIVFPDEQKLALLNQITHPEIIQKVKDKIEMYKKEQVKVLVIDAAILIEMGLQKLVDTLWLVTVSEQTQIKRIIDRDKFGYDDARSRIKAQLSNKEKAAFADFIINNDKPIEEVQKEVNALWEKLIS